MEDIGEIGFEIGCFVEDSVVFGKVGCGDIYWFVEMVDEVVVDVCCVVL